MGPVGVAVEFRRVGHHSVLTALPTLTNWQFKDWTPEAWAKSQRPARKAA